MTRNNPITRRPARQPQFKTVLFPDYSNPSGPCEYRIVRLADNALVLGGHENSRRLAREQAARDIARMEREAAPAFLPVLPVSNGYCIPC